MQKLDRLGWAAGMAVRAWGVRIGIRSNDPEILAEVAPYLPPGWKASRAPVVDRLYSLVVGGPVARPGVRRFNLLYGDWDRLARTRELSEVFTTLETDAQVFVAEAARRLVFVHAGVVGWQHRRLFAAAMRPSVRSGLPTRRATGARR